MTPKDQITPLDKEALVLLPGLRYAQALIEIAMQMCRHNALRPSGKTSDASSQKKAA